MKRIILPILLLFLVVAGCKPKDPNLVEAEPYSYLDSLYLENEFEEGYSYFLMNVDLPVCENDSLRLHILHWMLSPETEDHEAYIESVKNQFFEEEGVEPRSSYEENYTLAEQTDRYVTYITEGFMYSGGAHDMPWYYGTTFSKIDGSIVGYDMFDNPELLIPLISENLRTQYFETLEQDDYPIDFDEVTVLPTNEPWIETDCVVFCYQSFEIASYADGLPLCKISKEDLKPYLSEKGKSILF